ncbi:hypothetical protein MNBD_GAMMA16-329 [hydrothermal vent metagenome]|uniref:DUF11 domain-containing protein n=1 Tax=hydrothermal vent metagenome TaxID=652676 RepID=A0A3B0ZCS3_9ZZZZ
MYKIRLPHKIKFHAVCIFLLTLILSVNTVSAETFTVTTTADKADGSCDTSDCSLREAIIAANATAVSDTIILGAGTFELILGGIQAATEENNAATGDLDITSNIIIQGNGNTASNSDTIISAEQIDRIFHILSPNLGDTTPTRPVVTIRDLIITNGAVDARNGGALNNSTLSNTTLVNVTISNSSTTNLGSVLDMGMGGGVYNDGILSITESIITNNTAEVNQEPSGRYGGGGLYNDINSNTTLKGVTISSNNANNSFVAESFVTGGGILNRGTLFVLDNVGTPSIIGGNVAAAGNKAHSGGGISNLGGFLTIANTTVSNNTTIITANPADIESGSTGGGIFSQNAGTNRGSLVIAASTISNNYSDRQGGGVFNSGAPIIVTHTTIHDNTARFLGAGISNVGDQPAEITNSTIVFNQALDSANAASTQGGGLWTSSRINLNAVTLVGNIATVGDQLYVRDNSGVGEQTLEPQVSFSNTLVANSTANTSQANNNCGGDTDFIVSQNFNLDSGDTCTFANSSDQVNTDPLLSLDGLQLNQGAEGTIPPTKTIALQENSPAIDQGTGCPELDQRYFFRVNACDTGAYETNATDSSATVADMKITITENNDPVVIGNQLTYTLTIVNIGPHQASGVTVSAILPSAGIDGSVFFDIMENNLGSCSASGVTITCINVGTTTSGSSNVFPPFATVRISITVAPNAAGELSTTATVNSNVIDSFTSNNSETITTTISATGPGGGNANFLGSGGGGGGYLGFLSLLLLFPLIVIKILRVRRIQLCN